MHVCDKVAYNSHKEARDAAIAISEKEYRGLNPYFCNDCRKYHLATKGKRKFIRRVHQPTETHFKRGVFNKDKAALVPTSKHKEKMPKMISKEMAAHLKRLINASNEVFKQKNNINHEQ